jgi:predicted metal-dependent hydrolase
MSIGHRHRARPRPAGQSRQKTFSFQQYANDQPAQPKRHRQVLTVADRRVPLVYQINKRARRIILRFDHGEGQIVVVLPRRASLEQGRRFALLNKGWISERLDLLPEPVPFRAGAGIPFLGVMHRIRPRPQARGLVWQEDGEIHVAGRPEHLARRVEDWLKREARREIERRARAKAELIDKSISGITIRDPKSRWGSCSPRGRLSFSWRLILAPRHVIDYVVAHEVAHLKELNHGPRFWKLTAELTRDVEGARAWLNQHGPTLHRYGLQPV